MNKKKLQNAKGESKTTKLFGTPDNSRKRIS